MDVGRVNVDMNPNNSNKLGLSVGITILNHFLLGKFQL